MGEEEVCFPSFSLPSLPVLVLLTCFRLPISKEYPVVSWGANDCMTFFVFPECFRVLEATGRTCHNRKWDSFWATQDTSHHPSAISRKADWFWSKFLCQLVCALFTYLSVIFHMNYMNYVVKLFNVIILCTKLNVTLLYLILTLSYILTLAARFPTAFLVFPNFHSCFFNSIETWYLFSFS